MRTTLKRRLNRIEKAMPKPAAPSCSSAAPEIARRLAAMGIVRRSKESLAKTTARAMGILPQEIRRTLSLLAYGGEPR